MSGELTKLRKSSKWGKLIIFIYNQSCKRPGKWSRLWCYNDVFEVFSEDIMRASHDIIDNLVFFNLHIIP